MCLFKCLHIWSFMPSLILWSISNKCHSRNFNFNNFIHKESRIYCMNPFSIVLLNMQTIEKRNADDPSYKQFSISCSFVIISSSIQLLISIFAIYPKYINSLFMVFLVKCLMHGDKQSKYFPFSFLMFIAYLIFYSCPICAIFAVRKNSYSIFRTIYVCNIEMKTSMTSHYNRARKAHN